jgi:hypothetical protein
MEKSNMTETKDQRKGWLKDLKVGDQVFVVELRGVFSNYKTLATVEKITPTGRINVEGYQFPPIGSIFKDRSWTRLEQATNEAIESFYEDLQKAEYIRAINKGIDDKLISKMSKSDLEIIKKTFDKYIETETK